jgi:PAS domain-containing protein
METTKSHTKTLIAWEQVSLQAQRLQENLAKMGKIVREGAEILREIAARNWPKVRASALQSRAVLRAAAAKNWPKIRAGVQQGTAVLQNTAARNWPKIRASAQAGLVGTQEKIHQVGVIASLASLNAAVHLRRSQDELAKLGKRTGESLKRASQVTGEELSKLGKLSGESLRRASVATGAQLGKLRAAAHEEMVEAREGAAQWQSKISAAARQTGTQLQRAQGAALRIGKGVADAPRRLRDARSRRENDLQDLLANSPDAIVVTDAERRLVTANATALDLLGISEYNMKRFTIDAFLVKRAMRDVSGDGREDDKAVPCQIRRLDGGLRVAECVYLQEILPRRNLYRFLNAAPHRITPFVFAERMPRATAKRTAEVLNVRAAGKPAKLHADLTSNRKLY